MKTGLLNCNDLRFPEQARALKVKADVSAFVAVAWWPWRRTHIVVDPAGSFVDISRIEVFRSG